MTQASVFLALLLAFVAGGGPLAAQQLQLNRPLNADPPQPPAPGPSQPERRLTVRQAQQYDLRDYESYDEVSAFITSLVREQMPDPYTNEKDWGKTKKVTRGVKLQREGLKLKAQRRKKEVNHGTWKRYEVRLLDPKQQFDITVHKIEAQAGKPVRVDLSCTASVQAFGRLSKWQHGVQLISLSANADARLRMIASITLAVQLDPSKLPPDVILKPHVDRADIELVDFRLKRLSNLRGSAAHTLGKGLREALEKKIERDRGELATKLNRQIEKKQDKLRLSLHDLLASKWNKFVRLGSGKASPKSGDSPGADPGA